MKTPNPKQLIRLVVGSLLLFISLFLMLSAFMPPSKFPLIQFGSLLGGLSMAGVAVYLFSGAPLLAGVVMRVLLSAGLGFLTPLAFIVGGEVFENTRWETLAGCVATFLYCVTCQFWLLRKAGGGFRAGWPIMVGMVGSLLVACALLVAGGIFHNWPMVISGCVGVFAGALLSIRRSSRI
jgi:hypothetical protein